MVNFSIWLNDNQSAVIIFLSLVLLLMTVLFIYLLSELKKIKHKQKLLFSGEKVSSLESVILAQVSQIQDLERAVAQLKDADQRIINQMSYALQKIGVLRFNPFGDVGGNQSFAIALLDNHNSGVIILSLYSRDGVRVYSKAIKEGVSEYTLSEEEKKVLTMAMKG